MYKRYITILVFLAILVGCFFLFFDKDSNKELYDKYLNKLESREKFDNLSENKDLNINIVNDYVNNQYHYVITFTSNSKLNNFKALVISNAKNNEKYYPSFGIFDNENINLVNKTPDEKETKGVNLVVSHREKIDTFKVFVSYNNCEYFYTLKT